MIGAVQLMNRMMALGADQIGFRVIDTTGTNTGADCLNVDYIHLEVPAIGAPIACGLLGVATPTGNSTKNG